MLVSFMCPSRGRPESFLRSMESISNRAQDSSCFEVLVWLDNDDETAREYPRLPYVKYFTGARVGYARLNEVVNILARTACGRWLFLWNDDVVVRTDNWDVVLSGIEPTIVGNPMHNHGSSGLCVFPIVPRAWVDQIGHFALDGANDTWWQKIGEINGTLRPVPITLFHDRSDLTGNHDDQTRRENNYDPATFWAEDTQALIRVDAEELKSCG